MKATDGGSGSGGPSRRRRVRGRIGTGLATLALILIVGSWIRLGTTSPIVTVQTGSMVPTLHIGDMALMESLHGRPPKLGEIVVAPVPIDVQRQMHYPPSVTHRVVEIKQGRLTTKGDANAAKDPFSVPLSAVHTRLVTVIPGAGRFVRFMLSPFGILWLVFGAVVFLGPKLLDLVRDGMVPVAAGTPDSATLAELVLAVREYGQHLQSHTAVVQAMADASRDLSAVTARLEAASMQGGSPSPSVKTRVAADPRRRAVARVAPDVPRAEMPRAEVVRSDGLPSLVFGWDPEPGRSPDHDESTERALTADSEPVPKPMVVTVSTAAARAEDASPSGGARTRRSSVTRRPIAAPADEPAGGVEVDVVAVVPPTAAAPVVDAWVEVPVATSPAKPTTAVDAASPGVALAVPSAIASRPPPPWERPPPPWERRPFAIPQALGVGEPVLVVSPSPGPRAHTPVSEPPCIPRPAPAVPAPSVALALPGPRAVPPAAPWTGAPQRPLGVVEHPEGPPPWMAAGTPRAERAPWERRPRATEPVDAIPEHRGARRRA
jgi:signal peptidase I